MTFGFGNQIGFQVKLESRVVARRLCNAPSLIEMNPAKRAKVPFGET